MRGTTPGAICVCRDLDGAMVNGGLGDERCSELSNARVAVDDKLDKVIAHVS